MKLLVTGATGLLGTTAVLDHCGDHTVTAVHRAPLVLAGVRSEQLDLTDRRAAAALWDRVQPDLVLHCAAIASLEQCEQDPRLAHQVNVDATATVARLTADSGAKLVHVSTDAVFDGTAGPYREDDSPNPQSVYAATKLESEGVAQAACPDALVARVNFFGWSRTGSRSIAEFFVNALARRTAVTGFTDVEFASLYSRDLSRLLVEAGRRGLSGLYHVVSSDRSSKYDFGHQVATTFGLDPDLVGPGLVADLGTAVVRSRRLSLDPSKFAAAYGEPMPTLTQGLARMRQDDRTGFAARVRDTGAPPALHTERVEP